MNTQPFCHRHFHPLIARCAAIMLAMLVALAWSGLAFCDEIHDAVAKGDLEKVKALLKDNPNLVASRDDEGHTPLRIAAAKGQKDMAELLLAKGAEVNAKDNDGYTALILAAREGNTDVAKLLLANKADVNTKADNGETPLIAAARKDHKDIVELLLAKGAGVNDVGLSRLTPLCWAADKGYADVVELLLDKGADVNAKCGTGSGSTALQLADLNRYKDVVKLLREHGARK